MSTWRYMCTRGQGHSFTFVQGIIFGTSTELNETGSQVSDTGPLVLWLMFMVLVVVVFG